MAASRGLADVYARVGRAESTFDCCDTTFSVTAVGLAADRGVRAARRRATDLESTLNAFDEDSAVARLNREGRVENHHVARIVRRALEYADRTGGVFDVRHGRFEHALKAYIRGDSDAYPDGPNAEEAEDDSVRVDGDVVETDRPLDLNGLAKGYVVDRAHEALCGLGRTGTVDGGGDVASPVGPVAVESPFGGDRPLKVLDTDWHVASSAGYRRRRDGVDHVYDPATGRVGARADLVTVVARRDAMEADALATTLAALPRKRALDLVGDWPGAEALVVEAGVLHESDGFADHLWEGE